MTPLLAAGDDGGGLLIAAFVFGVALSPGVLTLLVHVLAYPIAADRE